MHMYTISEYSFKIKAFYFGKFTLTEKANKYMLINYMPVKYLREVVQMSVIYLKYVLKIDELMDS